MKSKITKRIEAEAKKIITDLYGTDVYQARKRLREFNDVVKESLKDFDDTADVNLDKLIKSKYTGVYLAAALVGSFLVGWYMGANL